MNDGDARQVGRVVFVVALVTRLAGVAVTTLTGLNSYAQADADRFARSAAQTAVTLASGHLPHIPTNPNRVVTLWGFFLSPLWLLPGPNRLYGRLFTAVVGALAIYGLYQLVSTLHSREGAVVATLPLIFYPSYVLVHSTVLREAFVLAGLVWASYLFAADPDSQSWFQHRSVRYVVAVSALALITIVRWENIPLYVLALGTGAIVRYRDRIPRPRIAATATAVTAVAGAWFARPLVRSGLDFLVTKRRRRSEGRTVYLPEFRPDTIPKAIGYAPIGAIYFLFTPFPWMIETVADAIVFVEALGNLAGAALALFAVPILWRRQKPVIAGLLVAFTAGVVLYGLVNANVGTNVRQRQMFLWVVFLFAGVTAAERFDLDRIPEWVEQRWPGSLLDGSHSDTAK